MRAVILVFRMDGGGVRKIGRYELSPINLLSLSLRTPDFRLPLSLHLCHCVVIVWLTPSKSIGELIKEFFHYFAFEWHFKNNVISIRSPNGILTKESKNWTTLAESTGSQSQTIKSRYLIAIEDPFEITHNVARTVNKQGRIDIRGEFMRAAKMLNSGSMRGQFLGDVCVERVLPERRLSVSERGENGANGERVLEKENELVGDG